MPVGLYQLPTTANSDERGSGQSVRPWARCAGSHHSSLSPSLRRRATAAAVHRDRPMAWLRCDTVTERFRSIDFCLSQVYEIRLPGCCVAMVIVFVLVSTAYGHVGFISVFKKSHPQYSSLLLFSLYCCASPSVGLSVGLSSNSRKSANVVALMES